MSELKHYGIARRSGRYPWGSGDNPYQNNKSFLAYVKELKDSGLSEKEQANAVDMTIAELRKAKSLATSEIRAEDYSFAFRLREKGYSYTEIGRRMGINESSVRSLLDPAIKKRSEITKVTSNMLKEAV